MAITKVQLFSIPVTDQGRAKDFYTNVLGFELVADMPMGPEQRWLQVSPRGAETSIALVTWFDTMPPGSTTGVVLETDDLEADIVRLTERGVIFEGAIQEQPWGRFATFADPDGNSFILQATTFQRP